MEKLALEKENLQQELKSLKNKVGEMNEQLGMLMETIQAKDEVIIRLSQQGCASAGGACGSPDCGSPSSTSKELQELDNLKVGAWASSVNPRRVVAVLTGSRAAGNRIYTQKAFQRVCLWE